MSFAKVEEAILKNRKVTVRELCDMILDVSITLTTFTVCQGLCKVGPEDAFGNGWILLPLGTHYTISEKKQQFGQWKHPEPPKPRKFKQTQFVGKVTVGVFW
ncbi:hypothetical protein Trydic_g6030 [Trypoxylus dichotomus]